MKLQHLKLNYFPGFWIWSGKTVDAWQGLLHRLCRIRVFRKPPPTAGGAAHLPAGKAGPLPPLPPGALVASLGGGTVGAPPPLNLYATFPRRVAATRMIDEQNHTYHMTHV